MLFIKNATQATYVIEISNSYKKGTDEVNFSDLFNPVLKMSFNL